MKGEAGKKNQSPRHEEALQVRGLQEGVAQGPPGPHHGSRGGGARGGGLGDGEKGWDGGGVCVWGVCGRRPILGGFQHILSCSRRKGETFAGV